MVLGLVATAGLAISVLPLPAASYVSEAGVAGSGHFVLYRASVIAAGLAAAALAAGLVHLFTLAALALFAAAPAIITSAVVGCTPGCPLPPYEATTGRDLVHAIASVIGVGCCGLAMLALARTSTGALRRLSWIAVLAGWPVLLGTGASMVVLGRGLATGLLERMALAVCLAWIIGVGLPRGWPAK
ncbi:hypothetical protein Rhe02_04870 [Rhizocola hellebori]|uniref:DUF998 domain-containing protein n=1 Tax=Rhizocola hellebori TaxID=1392758 RepID=A0A8J3Q389_9ACTN|nr:hypothetical protein Rhe02_04870 [Rhizocola hellebori]